jgi:hypothetical protein
VDVTAYDGKTAVTDEPPQAPPPDWRLQEQSLWAHFRRGTELDLGELGGGRALPGWAEWPAERVIAASVLANLLLRGPGPEPGAVCTLRLRGARISGQLALDGADIGHQVELVECHFEQPVVIRGARTRRLSLAGSWLPELRLHNIDVDGELALERIHASGLVDLADASITRSVRLMDATLSNARGPALMAERMRAGGALLCQGLIADGEIRLPGARIDGIVNLASAKLRSARGTALDGNGLTVGGSLFADRRRNSATGLHTVGRVFLAGARIGGDLDLTGAVLELSPGGLAAGSRGLPASSSGPNADADTDPTAALVAERAVINGNLEIDEGFTARGTIRLASAVIKGNIRATHCTIEPAEPVTGADRFAVLGDGLELGGELLCSPGFTAHGELLLRAATVGGNVFLDDAVLIHPYRNAINLDRTTIQGDLSMRKLTAKGTVRLQNAIVGGSALFDGARLDDAYGADATTADRIAETVTVRPSLDARAAQVGRDFQCHAGRHRPFIAAAGVRLRGADVGKSVSFRGAVVDSSGGDFALNLFGLRSTELVLALGAPAGGLVELSHVHAAAVYDNAHLWRSTGGVRLDDFEYGGITVAEGSRRTRSLPGSDAVEDGSDQLMLSQPLPDTGEPSARGRVRWMQAGLKTSNAGMEAAADRHWQDWFGRRRRHSGYTPQPYEQLAAHYRADGHDHEARYVLLAKQRHQRKTRGLAGRITGRMLDLTVGYGYRTWLALIWLGGLWAIGYACMRNLHPATIDSGLVGSQWSPALFTLDLLLPIIGFEQEGIFAMTGAYRWVAASLELAGWVLATAVVAGLSRALQRRD